MTCKKKCQRNLHVIVNDKHNVGDIINYVIFQEDGMTWSSSEGCRGPSYP